MCGRFFIETLIDGLTDAFGAAVGLSAHAPPLPRYNVAPGTRVHAVREGSRGRELVDLQWGLVPSWAQDPTIGYRTVNARSETAHDKPAFREAFRKRRCLIPSTGFYEWKTGAGGVKQPYAARRDGGRLHAMAGLWETWTSPTGDRLETFTILTCPANTRLRALHERMPVVLPRVEWAMWLDPRVEGVEALRAMLRPDDSRRWTYHPVSRRVNTPKNDGPELLKEVMDEAQGLFGG